jgi:hypothetical protein
MSTIANAPVSIHHNSSTAPLSESEDLSVILAGIKLDDGEEEDDDDDVNQPSSLSAILSEVASKLNQVRNQFFVIQERRHAGVFALAEQSSNGSSNGVRESPSQPRSGVVAEKSVALDLAMAQLNSLLESISENMKAADVIVNRYRGEDKTTGPMAGFSPRRRTASVASLSSLDSFDDAFLNIDQAADTPKALAKRYEELSLDWEKVQAEASKLEEELSSDKHLLVFISICEQMEGMMDSLDKALASCHDFIFAIHRERADNALQLSESQWASPKERLADYMAVKRSFDVKKSSYGPACEQMFVTLQKGLAQKSIQNGTILRQLADLKTRWRGLRESVGKTDKDLKRVEAELIRGGDVASSPAKSTSSDLLVTPSRPDRPRSRLGGKTTSATNTPTGMRQTMSLGDSDDIDMTPLRPSNTNSRAAPTPKALVSPPAKPAKSIYRHSFIAARPSTSDQLPQSRSFSSTAVLNARQAPDLQPGGPSKLASRSVSGDSSHIQRAGTESASRYTRAGSEPPNRDGDVSSRRNGGYSGNYTIEDSDMTVGDTTFTSAATELDRPGSALDMYKRPTSAAGFYYRPPSAAGHRGDVNGGTRIPRLSIGTKNNDDQSVAGDRPGSSLSNASTTAYGKSPSARMSYTRSAYPPSSFPRNADHGNRLSMQTPEPTIAARAKRMNIFAPKVPSTTSQPASKRSSRPPPAKYNASVYGQGSSTSMNGHSSSSSTSGTSPYRLASVTTPLVINKRSSMTWSATGRTTPLSAAALAKVPHAGPDLGPHIQSEEKSSVNNFRAQRTEQQSAGSRSYTPSVRSGRETPTFSDAGGSSVWGGGLSRRMAAVYSYRANPNDAIDVEVGNIVNSLGMAIERVDPPLPKGVKDLSPPSTKTVKYEVGGKVIVVKLLQLVSLAALERWNDADVTFTAPSCECAIESRQDEQSTYESRRWLDRLEAILAQSNGYFVIVAS